MNRNSKGAKRRRKTIPVWTYAQAQAALPYIASIVRSLREHELEARAHRLTLERLADQPGRPDRAALVAHQEVARQLQEAEDRFQDALAELQELDIDCIDAVRGEAAIPFVHENQLAWFLYGLFDSQPLSFWRYDSDSLETRRPLIEALQGSAESTRIV
jgi:hypothetical protein